MKKLSVNLGCLKLFTSIVIMIGLATSCKNEKQTKDYSQEKIDSLTLLAQNQSNHILEMEEFITSLSETMDSINVQEKELIIDGDIEKRKPRTRESIINNLKRYKETIERQKKMIANLENQLSAKNDEMSAKMLQIVSFYKQQLDEKDRTIASLQKSISENKNNIKHLQASVTELLTTTQEQKETIREQKDALARQSDMINTCYVMIGTKKQLKSAGVVTGGFLKKTKLNDANISLDKFTEMDMRRCNDIVIKSSNPKILTQMPVSSYSIIKNSDGTSYLHITDPNTFWSISRFLVIQL